jgi:hypothetical protein
VHWVRVLALAGVNGYGNNVVERAAIGAIASHLGGASAGMGAFSAVFEYLYNKLVYAKEREKAATENLAKRSPTFAERLEIVKNASEEYTLKFDDEFAGTKGSPGNVGPEGKGKGGFLIRINPTTAGNFEYLATDRRTYIPGTVEQVLAHELGGHASIIAEKNFVRATEPFWFNQAITIENKIMREVYPSRPDRIERHDLWRPKQ